MRRWLVLLLALLLLLTGLPAMAEEQAEETVDPALRDAVRAYLDTNEYTYDFYGADQYFYLGFSLECKFKTCEVNILLRPDGLSVIAYAPLDVEADRKADVAELITRINYTLTRGGFQMDWEDGELIYYCRLDTFDTVPSETVLAYTLETPWLMLEKYGDALISVMLEDVDAATAFNAL